MANIPGVSRFTSGGSRGGASGPKQPKTVSYILQYVFWAAVLGFGSVENTLYQTATSLFSVLAKSSYHLAGASIPAYVVLWPIIPAFLATVSTVVLSPSKFRGVVKICLCSLVPAMVVFGLLNNGPDINFNDLSHANVPQGDVAVNALLLGSSDSLNGAVAKSNGITPPPLHHSHVTTKKVPPQPAVSITTSPSRSGTLSEIGQSAKMFWGDIARSHNVQSTIKHLLLPLIFPALVLAFLVSLAWSQVIARVPGLRGLIAEQRRVLANAISDR